MAKSIKKTAVLVKLEVTEGTDAVPTGAANALLIKNVTLEPVAADTAERTLVRPFYGNYDQIVAATHMKVDFEVDLSGSGTAGTAPQVDALLQMCAMSVTTVAATSVTYAPVSDAIKSGTIYVNVDGTNHKLTGARGTVSATLTAKGLPGLKFSVMGAWNALTDTPLPVASYANVATPVPVNKTYTTLSLHGQTLIAQDVMLDVANQSVFRSLIGFEGVLITDRKSAMSCTFESVPVAIKDWSSIIRSTTYGALALTHGIVAGNIVQISVPKVQLKGMSYSDSDNIQMTKVDGNVIPVSGNDEFSIVFK